jgi:uncharacterized protein YukE
MTYTNPIPTNYDNTTISVDTGELAYSAQQISAAVTTIANSLSDINKQLNGLSLSWLGNASDQAQTYADNWNNVVQMLFGATDANGNVTDDDGALSVLVNGLNQAISNYNTNEVAVANLFSSFGSASNSSGSQKPVDAPTVPISNATGIQEYLYHTTAVNETF